MIWLTLYFCAGIIFAQFNLAPFWLIYSGALILLSASFIFIRTKLIFSVIFACLIFSLAAALLKNSYILAKSHISHFISYKNETIFTVRGFINNQPQLKDNRFSFMFVVRELEFNRSHYNTCGEILVHLKGIRNLAYGEALILRGSIHKPYKLYGLKAAAVMYVTTPVAVVRLNENYGWPIKRFAFFLKEKIEKIIYRRISLLAASIVDAMILGEKKNIPSIIYDSMIKSGTVHILVVSGFNVGVVAFLIMLTFKVLRLPRIPRYIASIFCLVIYCFATGAQAPVVRATVMAIFFLSGFLLKREPDMRNSFALAALFILFIQPAALFSISFQLSFASVAAIIFLYPKLKSFFRIEAIKLRFLRVILEGGLVSLSAWLGTFGIILYYFRIFSPVTLLANLFIVPLATLITLSGFSLVLISLFFPFLAAFFASSLEFFVLLLLSANSLLIRLPFAYLYC